MANRRAAVRHRRLNSSLRCVTSVALTQAHNDWKIVVKWTALWYFLWSIAILIEVDTMLFEFSLYALILGFVTLLGIFLLIYPIFFRPKSRLSGYFILLIASAVIWAFGYTLDIAITDYSAMVFLNYVQYVGIVTLPVFFFFFILYLTKDYAFREKPLLLLLFFPPLIHYTLMLTNDFHHLYYITTVFNPGAPFARIDYLYGPFFYSNTIYSSNLG